MERATHIIILTLISCFEIWMCYQILYRTVLEKRYLQTWQKILIWGNILGMGIVLGVNRNMLFFSSAMLWGCIVFTMLIALFLHVKKWKLIAEIVGIYFLFVALLDFFFFFCRMAVENDVYYVFYKGDYFVDKSILYILSRISISVMLICFKKEKKGESILKKTQMFLLITAGILVVIVTGYHFLIYDILNGLSDISGWSAACSLLAIFVVVAFCLGISWKNQSLKQENQILEVREKLELDNMRDMTKALEQNRIQVHDMRHHMIILREYALKKEYEAIETYLDQLLESYVEVQEERWTRIRNLDILLSEKKKEANLENIRFQIETDVLQSLPFKETETSVLFGNLLDNAIEACKKMKTETRWIRVEIRQRKGFLFFTIANSIGKRPQEKDGQFYQETQNQRYIQEAERAICLMLPQMIKTECGVGWNPESVDVPIGGMAHGNAGILMPVLVLWELTKKKEYGWLAEKIWEYEESLYREETGNWMDIRDHSDEGEDTVAWCHGAAGILLSRLWCYEKVTDSKWKKRLKKDIDRAYQKTSAFWKRDSWSLCHGNSGNLWILNLADRMLGKERKERGNYEKIRLLPQERMNPGLMGGYGGVLLHLLVKLIR